MQSVEEYGLTAEQLADIEVYDDNNTTEEDYWVSIAADAFRVSDTFYGSSIKKQIDRNIDQFNSRHPSGSKYNSASYKYRSKIFRPKTRSSIRRHEAAAAAAFFSTSDVVSIKPSHQSDKEAALGANILQNLVNDRLADPTMWWFETCMGAYQDAMVQGVVISRQEWIYEEEPQEVSNGVLEMSPKIRKDHPASRIIPTSNFRFDPNADWRDPIESSPYLIEIIPMYRCDLKDLMRQGVDGSGITWKPLDDDDLGGGRQEENSIQYTRNRGRQKPEDQKHVYSDFDIIWTHLNVIRVDGQDIAFYTLNEQKLLTEPVPIKQMFPHGRPYVMGFCNLETHKTHPASPVEMMGWTQQEINDIANQRLDNVKLVVNRRSFVRRNSQIDVRALTQSIPGGVTLVDDIDKDVRYDAPPDVTSSSYQEQDRLNNDFDELAGSFSGSSVASNRAMNETVGGMEIMSQDANSVTDYQLKIFSETWLRRVLAQFVELEKIFESDVRRLNSASNGLDPKEAVVAMQADVITRLSVGYGATNPQKQVEKLAFGLNTMATFLPDKIRDLDSDEVIKEIFGSLGYQDGKRFFVDRKEEDPRIQELTQQIQELNQVIQQKQIETQGKIQVEQVKQDGNMKREEVRNQTQERIAKLDQQIDYIKEQIAAERNDIERGRLSIEESAFDFNKKQKELDYAIGERDRMSELLMNDKYGLAPNIDEGAGPG